MAFVTEVQTMKTVRIHLPPIAETDATASEAPASPLKRRRARFATKPGEHYYKYPNWFCSPDYGPHCCGTMSEALKDQFYNEQYSPIQTRVGDEQVDSRERTSVPIQTEPAKESK